MNSKNQSNAIPNSNMSKPPMSITISDISGTNKINSMKKIQKHVNPKTINSNVSIKGA